MCDLTAVEFTEWKIQQTRYHHNTSQQYLRQHSQHSFAGEYFFFIRFRQCELKHVIEFKISFLFSRWMKETQLRRESNFSSNYSREAVQHHFYENLRMDSTITIKSLEYKRRVHIENEFN